MMILEQTQIKSSSYRIFFFFFLCLSWPSSKSLYFSNNMASYRSLSFLAMLLMLLVPMIAKGDLANDFLGKVCDEVECGKGRCVANTSYPLNFICECQSGWKRTRDSDNDTFATSFLPCVIPQCTLNYGCQSAPPPVSDKDLPHNISTFDPCYWAYCGDGTCKRGIAHTYSCECNPNYYNLLNISVYPCYSECTLGSDCSKLGIKVANSTTEISGQDSAASSIIEGRFNWIVMLLVSAGVAMLN